MNTGPQSPAGAAQAAPADPADRRERVTGALYTAFLNRITSAESTTNDIAVNFSMLADVVLAALPELAAADQLRTALVALIEEMTDDATELGKASRAVRAEGNDAAANALTTRAGMTADLTDRLRTLLEET